MRLNNLEMPVDINRPLEVSARLGDADEHPGEQETVYFVPCGMVAADV